VLMTESLEKTITRCAAEIQDDFRRSEETRDRIASPEEGLMGSLNEYAEEITRDQDDAVVFALRIAMALQQYGLPSHRLEETMSLLDRHLRLESQFYSSPTMLMATFGYDRDQRTYLFRPPAEEVNLEKLDLVFMLAREVGLGRLSASEGLTRLEELKHASDRYRPALMALCHLLCCAGAARLFGGGWREILIAAVIGFGVAQLIQIAGHRPALGRVLIPLSGIGAMVLAKLATVWLGPYSLFIASVCGLIVLLPGLTLTTSVTELAQGNPVSGSSRFSMAAITFLMLAFGIALGGRIESILPFAVQPGEAVPLPDWTGYLAQVIVPLAFVVIFHARPRDAGWVFASGLIAFYAARFGAGLLGPQLGAFVAAFVVALFANAFARWLERPSSIPLLPGIMLLVPGSLGYRSIQALLDNRTLPGLETAFTMMLVAVALVAGLVFAGILLPPRSPIPATEGVSNLERTA